MDTGRFGWGGWTRTNTVLINSEVSYQLDHAPNRCGTAAENRRDDGSNSSGFWTCLLALRRWIRFAGLDIPPPCYSEG